MAVTGFSAYPSRKTPATMSSDMNTFLSEMAAFVTSMNSYQEGAKARGVLGVSGNIIESFNISSITDGGTGKVTVTLDTDFSNANYTIVATAQENGNYIVDVYGTPAVGSFILYCYSAGGGNVDPTYWHFACFGTQ